MFAIESDATFDGTSALSLALPAAASVFVAISMIPALDVEEALPLGKFVSWLPSTAGSFADPSSTTTLPALVPVSTVEAVPNPVT